jgi:hypothetical protein
MFSHLAFLFMLFHVAIHMTQPQNRFLFLYPFQIAQLTFVIAIGFQLMAAMTEDKPFMRMGPGTILALILLAWGHIAHYAGPLVVDTTWIGGIDPLTKAALAAILLEATATNIYRVWAVYATILISTLWWLKGGFRLSTSGGTLVGDRIMGPAVSMIENPNAYAYFTCVTIFVYLYFYQQVKNKYFKMAFMGMALLSVFIVFNTGSRGGMVLLAAMTFLLLPKYGRQHKGALIGIVLAVPVVIGLVAPGNIERFKTIPDSFRALFSGEEISLEDARGADEHSAIERKLKNRQTWALIKQYPLMGTGMNPDQDLYPADLPQARGQVHNELLRAGITMGFPGMAIYLAMLGILVVYGRRVERYAKGWWPAMADMGWSLKLQGLAILVGGQFAVQPWNVYTLVLMAMASALWLNLQEGALQPERVEVGS